MALKEEHEPAAKDSKASVADSCNKSSLQQRFRRGAFRIIKGILPPLLVKEIKRYRTFNPRERSLYITITVTNAVRRSRKLPAEARSFLFLCFGNIMRSPMCEALMNRAIEGSVGAPIHVYSAGLNAKPGTPAHPWALAAARDFGISLDEHRSRAVTAELLQAADVIFVMDYENLVHLRSRYQLRDEKVFLLGQFARPRQLQIRDPYYGDQEETRRCYAILKQCVENVVETMFPAQVFRKVSGDPASDSEKVNQKVFY